MLPTLEQNLPQIGSLCRKYGVRCLEVFGSAARGDFDPSKSDFDFLVLYHKNENMSAYDRYFGLLEDLEKLLGRKVDLVDIMAARNPYFIADALEHRIRLYAA